MSAYFLILGKNGQLGRALTVQLGAQAIAASRKDIDLASPDFISMLEHFVAEKKIRAVFNAAAYTQVDKAENEGRKEAFRVNAKAVGELAAWCKARHLPLVHYSTDYVFDGSGSEPRKEEASTLPLGAYGASKREGEELVAASSADYLIFRTSWVYDAQGKNFFNTMLRLFGERESLKIVNDQIGAPTYAPQLANASIQALNAALALPRFPSGIYHLAAAGETSWYGFAQAIFTLARSHDSVQKSQLRCVRIDPITTSEYPLPAKRPLNSRLDCSKARNVLGVSMPDWKAGLTECFKEKYASTGMPNSGAQNHPAGSLRG